MAENPHTGSSFDDFLKEEGINEECTASALKRVLAWQIKQEMNSKHITKSAMADLMKPIGTSTFLVWDPCMLKS